MKFAITLRLRMPPIAVFCMLLLLGEITAAASKLDHTEDKSCNVAGKTYHHRQLFVRSCNEHCMCYNGLVTCTNPCAHEYSRPPMETCSEPRLVRIPGQCCQEWQCLSPLVPPFANSSSVFNVTPGQTEENDVDYKPRGNQQPQRNRQMLREAGPAPTTTASEPSCPDNQAWSQCSTTCGPGVSTYYDCKQKKLKSRICNVRPCSMVEDEKESNCRPTVKSRNAVLIHFEDCWSVRKYRPKYCGMPCHRRGCCMPREVSTKTKRAKFECLDGRNETREIMWIKRCECNAPC